MFIKVKNFKFNLQFILILLRIRHLNLFNKMEMNKVIIKFSFEFQN